MGLRHAQLVVAMDLLPHPPNNRGVGRERVEDCLRTLLHLRFRDPVGVWMCAGVWVCGCVGVWMCGCVGYRPTAAFAWLLEERKNQRRKKKEEYGQLRT